MQATAVAGFRNRLLRVAVGVSAIAVLLAVAPGSAAGQTDEEGAARTEDAAALDAALEEVFCTVGGRQFSLRHFLRYAIVRSGFEVPTARSWMRGLGAHPRPQLLDTDRAFLEPMDPAFIGAPFPKDLLPGFRRSDADEGHGVLFEGPAATVRLRLPGPEEAAAYAASFAALANAPRVTGDERAGLVHEVLVAGLACRGRLADHLERFRLWTWLDVHDFEGPIARALPAGAILDFELPPWRHATDGAAADLALFDSPALMREALDAYGPSTREFDWIRAEFVWILRAHEVLRRLDVAPDPDGVWGAMARSPRSYDLRARADARVENVTTHRGRHGPSEFATRAVASLHRAFGLHQMAQGGPDYRDPAPVEVNVAVWVSFGKEQSEGLREEAARFVAHLSDRRATRSGQFDAQRAAEYRRLEAAQWPLAGALPYVQPMTLTPEELVSNLAVPYRGRKLPAYFEVQGRFGLNGAYHALTGDVKPGVVGPLEFGMGWIVLDVTEVPAQRTLRTLVNEPDAQPWTSGAGSIPGAPPSREFISAIEQLALEPSGEAFPGERKGN